MHSQRLLIVEDEPSLAGAMAEHFRNRGYQVEVALEFERAASLMSSSSYDLLLTDLHLASIPGVEGFMLVLETRTLHPNLPIIILTGYESEDIKSWTLSYPHSAFLRKPTSLFELEAQVSALLGKSRRGLA